MLDLAVVGGGVAGAHAAYRLARLRPDWSIALFESSGRIGGRLLSIRPPGTDARAELGGMRYRTTQPFIQGLVDELGLESRPFPTVHDDNRYFLRGRHLRPEDFRDTTRIPYELGNAGGRGPAEALFEAVERVAPGASPTSGTSETLATREVGGNPLIDWAFGDVLQATVGEDARRYIEDGMGYTSILGERNAAHAIPWLMIEARPETENRTLVDGMERLPRELASRFEAVGGRVHLRHHLTGLDDEPARDGEAGYRLRFERGPSVAARRVVLALSRQALERLASRSRVLGTPEAARLLSSVTAHDMAKLFLGYDRPWWRDLQPEALRSISDLPLRKTYYFDQVAMRNGEPLGLLLASYCDGPDVLHWRGLAGEDLAPRVDEAPYGSAERSTAYPTSDEMVRDAQHQLAALHDRESIPEPVWSSFMDWGRAPFGGAWHSWNVSVKTWEVAERIVQPSPNHAVYVCGEAYSASQGWVEGALETSNEAVRRIAEEGGR